jgi:hypothetical protein
VRGNGASGTARFTNRAGQIFNESMNCLSTARLHNNKLICSTTAETVTNNLPLPTVLCADTLNTLNIHHHMAPRAMRACARNNMSAYALRPIPTNNRMSISFRHGARCRRGNMAHLWDSGFRIRRPVIKWIGRVLPEGGVVAFCIACWCGCGPPSCFDAVPLWAAGAASNETASAAQPLREQRRSRNAGMPPGTESDVNLAFFFIKMSVQYTVTSMQKHKQNRSLLMCSSGLRMIPNELLRGQQCGIKVTVNICRSVRIKPGICQNSFKLARPYQH